MRLMNTTKIVNAILYLSLEKRPRLFAPYAGYSNNRGTYEKRRKLPNFRHSSDSFPPDLTRERTEYRSLKFGGPVSKARCCSFVARKRFGSKQRTRIHDAYFYAPAIFNLSSPASLCCLAEMRRSSLSPPRLWFRTEIASSN